MSGLVGTKAKITIAKKVLWGVVGVIILLAMAFGGYEETKKTQGEYVIDYTSDLIIFSEIKGTGNVPDEIAQLAVGVAVKYKLLPSVIISQWAYESDWGRSQSATNDMNFFGITWFSSCPFPKGSSRGVGGSEGGSYMQFPDVTACFNYYGYMVAKQKNFNACVGNKDPGDCLLVLGNGGYATAGITKTSPYFKWCTNIINVNELTQYDDFAIEHWQDSPISISSGIGSGDLSILENVLGQKLNNGECYGLTAYYVEKMDGPKLMGSGFSYAQNIGEDYNWVQYGWQTIPHPELEQIHAGDIINWKANGMISHSIYGHTGVVISVSANGTIQTYEQNAGAGRICAKYTRTYNANDIKSIVQKIR